MSSGAVGEEESESEGVRDGYKEVQLGPKEVEIPEEWTVERITNVCHLNPYSFDADEHEGDTFEYIDIDSVSPGQIEQSKTTPVGEAPSRAKRRVKAGNTLVGKVRPYLRAFAPVTEEYDDCVCSTGFAVLEAKNSTSSSYVTQTTLSKYFLDQMTNRMTGTSYPAVSKSDFENVEILTPPLPKQRRIADILSTVDEEIQQTEEIIGKAKELRKGLIQTLVFYGADHDDTQTVQLGPMTTEMAASWDVTAIDDVTSTVQYGTSESLSTEGEYPIFRMNNIEEGRMVASPMKYVDLEPEEAEKYMVEQGDILFNRTNSIDLVGKSGIFDLDGDFVFASYLIRVQTTEEMNPYFLNYYLNSHIGQGILYSYATRGASQANINATSLKSIKAPLPPREQQDRIVEQIQTVEQKIEKEREYKRELQQLKRGLMQDLLTGQVRVTPDE